MGAVIGGAIGSVIGISLKSENKTPPQKEQKKTKRLKITKIFRRKKKPKIDELVLQDDELKKIPHE